MDKEVNYFIGKSKWELDTLCLVIDKSKLMYNIEAMQSHCNSHNVRVRPHAKTHKNIEICKYQIESGAIGISVAKISEAFVLSMHNLPGILVTSPVVTKNKIKTLFRCIERSPDICVVIDSLSNAVELNALAKEKNFNLNVLIDIDPGIGRTGVLESEALYFAKKISELSNLCFQGIQCYAGNLQHIPNFEERKQMSLGIMKSARNLFDELQNSGISCNILTGSGTGTYDIDLYANVTEVQPGSYTVMDVEYDEIEYSKNNRPDFKNALTLLTTVISSNRKEHVTVDAGWKAIYINDNKPKIISHNGLHYEWGGFGDEHGKITSIKSEELPKTGDVLELVVPHCDPTINLFDHFYVTENDIIIDIFDIQLRGKSQ